MKKPTEKRIKECLKNIPANFSELMAAMLWYENNNMDDWAYDIRAKMFKLPMKLLLECVVSEFKNIQKADLSESFYEDVFITVIASLYDKKEMSFVKDVILKNSNSELIDYFNSLDGVLEDGKSLKEFFNDLLN